MPLNRQSPAASEQHFVRTKICGLQTPTDVQAAVAAGADELGFICALARSRAELEPSAAQALISYAASICNRTPVLVTDQTDAEEILALARRLGVHCLQLHALAGAILPARLRAGGVEVRQALPVTGRETLGLARLYSGSCDQLHLDSPSGGNCARSGGSGTSHDWSYSREIREQSALPIVLAGGLTPDNVASAVAAVRPSTVDVHSGVKNADGDTDRQLAAAFVRTAHSVDLAL